MSYLKKNLPIVVIFGRTNVGKSTLFNRLTEKQQALVSDIEGTTRDSNVGVVDWRNKEFSLIDTGGIMDIGYLSGQQTATDDIEAKVQAQARSLLKRADLILFLVDNKTGLLPQDKEMALILKKTLIPEKPVLLVANKVDNLRQRLKTAKFHKLALGDPIPVSAINGTGSGDLLDIIVARLKTPKTKKISTEAKIEHKGRVCILGKTNVGKSSLLNSVLGEDRVIVSETPHTTREPQDTEIIYQDTKITLVDTAGISKKGMQRPRTKKDDTLDRRGIAKSLKALDRADIALMVIDINEEITHQDQKIVEEIVKRKKSLILIANKWDLIKEKDPKKYKDYIYSHLPFVTWAPVHFISALTGAKVSKIMELVLEVAEKRRQIVNQPTLNTFLKKVVKIHRPTKGKGTKYPRIYQITQTRSNPPEFTVRIGPKDDLHFSYVRFLENRIRERFDFLGTPISIYIKKGKTSTGL